MKPESFTFNLHIEHQKLIHICICNTLSKGVYARNIVFFRWKGVPDIDGSFIEKNVDRIEPVTELLLYMAL